MFSDFKIIKKCTKTNGRVSKFELANNILNLPVYMPVATYGAMRGVMVNDLEEEIILSNTYHLRNLNKNIKRFMGWNKSMLTDSGGFQIQSLPDVKVIDAGVMFGNKLFTPEQSMDAQMILGADIIMQLDDVVNPMEKSELHVKAIARSIEWLDRAIIHIEKTNKLNYKNIEIEESNEINNNKTNDKITITDNITNTIKTNDTDNTDNTINATYGTETTNNTTEDAIGDNTTEGTDNTAYATDNSTEKTFNKSSNNSTDKVNESEDNEFTEITNTITEFTDEAVKGGNSSEGTGLYEETICYKIRNVKKLKKTEKYNKIPNINCWNNQILFPIIQGGLIESLRSESIKQILLRKPKGLAIGGLSGGENKNDFYRIVHMCCINLPDNIPRYLMGVGYPEDIVVCFALGVDMSDCVYPTRTARFGRGFCDTGDILINNSMSEQLIPISTECKCETCNNFTRSYLALLKGSAVFCMLMSRHNLYYMRNLTRRIRESILENKFPQFISEYMNRRFQNKIPEAIINALKLVNVNL